MSGNPIEVELIFGLAESPAAQLATLGWLECVEKGLSDGNPVMRIDQNAVLGYVKQGQERTPAGVITFEHVPHWKQVFIVQSYVLPQFRGQGVYSAMFNRLVEHAIVDMKATNIQSSTHVRNVAMRAIAKKQGRFEECVTLRMNLV